jgi:hypothetical protein
MLFEKAAGPMGGRITALLRKKVSCGESGVAKLMRSMDLLPLSS